MKNFIKILILPIAIITMLGCFAPRAFAVTPLSVQFVPNPLFDKPNFLPQDTTSGTITITNNGDTTQDIATEAINVIDNDNFGSLLHLKIMEGSVTLYNDPLSTFFSTAGEFPLGTLNSGETKTFNYTISFTDSNDNSYQGKTLGFDVCIGFLGGNLNCGDTTIGGEDGGGTTGGGTISGSSSSGSTTTPLIIFNEQALNIFNVGTSGIATITWDTNKLATSQVVYGPISSPPSPYTFPYTLTLIPPNFGYPFYTVEDGTKVINHSMLLTGLTLGQTYKFRVISRASPATISPEFEFTVPLPAQINNGLVLGASTENGTGSITSGRQGSVLGASTENNGDETSAGNILGASAAPLSSNLLSLCFLISLLILILIYLIWKLLLRRRYERRGIPEEIIQNRFYLFFGGLSLLAIIVCLIFGIYCPLPVFIISTIISACFYVYRKLRSK